MQRKHCINRGIHLEGASMLPLAWKQFLNFCNLNDYTYYSCSLKDLYIAEITHREPKYKDSTIMRKTQCIKMLDLMYYRGGWQKGELNPSKNWAFRMLLLNHAKRHLRCFEILSKYRSNQIVANR